jgi:hypothetical protein
MAKTSFRSQIVSIVFVFLIAATLVVFVSQIGNRIRFSTSASTKPAFVTTLMTSDTVFTPATLRTVDFSTVPCCQTLTGQYSASGVTFTSGSGWGTYQANGFANSLSTAPTLPGAPTGTTGIRLSLVAPTNMLGFNIQSGSPYSTGYTHLAKPITIKAYNSQNAIIFQQTTDTCLGQASSCLPVFVGVQSNVANLQILEVTFGAPYSWSIDNLKWNGPAPTK